jgi:tight adherence protein B
MLSTELWIIYALVFGAVLLAVQGLYLLLFKARHEKTAINRRLVLSSQLNNPNEVLEVLRRERGVEFLAGIPAFRQLNDLAIQSGVRFSAVSMGVAFSALVLLLFAMLSYATGSGLIAFVSAIPGAAALIYLYLRVAQRRRISAFSEQFPDALDVMVRGLRAGHPLRVAVGLVAREMPDPVGSEFGIITDEVMFGLEQSIAIDNLTRRVGHPDLLFFATAVNVQQQTGGNLAEILTRLSHLLRSRSKLRLKIRALSAEGRMSAVALSAAPFALFGIITLVSPEYFGSVRNHPVLPLATGFGLFLLAVGNVIMYRMVNFKF